MDLLRQLRAIENGKLPKGEDLAVLGDARVTERISFDQMVQSSTSPVTKDDDDDDELTEEAKDGTVGMDNATIMSLVNEPYSGGGVEEHSQHSLPLSFYKMMVGGGSKVKGNNGSKDNRKKRFSMGGGGGSVTSSSSSFSKPPLPAVISVPASTDAESIDGTASKIGREGSPGLGESKVNNNNYEPSVSQLSFASSFAAAGEAMTLPQQHKMRSSSVHSEALPPSPHSLTQSQKQQQNRNDINSININSPYSFHPSEITQSQRVMYDDRDDDASANNDVASIHSLHSVNSKDSTVKNVRKMRTVEQRWNEQMQAEKRDSLMKEGRITRKIDKEIDFTVKLLPVELLIKHGKFELVKERALTRMWDLLLRMRLNLLRMATGHWKSFVLGSLSELKVEAGATLVRIARGFLGRQKFRLKHKAYLEELRRQGRMKAVKAMGTTSKIIMIQAALRRKVAYMRTMPLLRMHRAAVFVAIFFRKQMLLIAARRKVREAKMMKESIVQIQKIVRAYFGRKRFRARRKEHTNELFRKRYETPESTMRYYFEQGGAATKIQLWFRNRPWYVKAKWRHKFLAFYTHRKAEWSDASGSLERNRKKKEAKLKRAKRKAQRKAQGGDGYMSAAALKKEQQGDIADALNPAIRGFLGRRRVAKLRAQRAIQLELRKWASIIVQKHVRRTITIARMPTIGVRVRSFRRKERLWGDSLGWQDCLAQQELQKLVEEETFWGQYAEAEAARMKRMTDRDRRMYTAEKPEHLTNGTGRPSFEPQLPFSSRPVTRAKSTASAATGMTAVTSRPSSRESDTASGDGAWVDGNSLEAEAVSTSFGQGPGATTAGGAVVAVSRPVTAGVAYVGDSSRPGTRGWEMRPGSRLGSSADAAEVDDVSMATNAPSHAPAAGAAGRDAASAAGRERRSTENNNNGGGGGLKGAWAVAADSISADDEHNLLLPPSKRYFHKYPALHISSKRHPPFSREVIYIRHHREKVQHRLASEKEKRYTPFPYGDEDATKALYLRQRRNAITLGPHHRYAPAGHNLQMHRAKDIDKMVLAARKIGRGWRSCVSRAKFHEFMQNKQSFYIVKLVRWSRVCVLRRRILRFRALLTDELQGHTRIPYEKGLQLIPLWQRCVVRRTAAFKIQRRYRVHLSMIWLRNFKKARIEASLQMQRFFRRRIVADPMRRFQLNKLRSTLETKDAGEQQFDQTLIFMHIDRLWSGAQKVKSLNVPYDLQKYFTLSGNGMIESSRFLKQMLVAAAVSDLYSVEVPKPKKGSKTAAAAAAAAAAAEEEKKEEGDDEGKEGEGAMKRGMPLNSGLVEDMFLKVKALSDKRIAYEHFLDLLCNLAIMRFLGYPAALLPNGEGFKPLLREIDKIENMSGTGPNGGLSDDVREVMYDSLIDREIAISREQCIMTREVLHFHFGRQYGRPALICKFIFRYLAHTAEYKKSVGQLGKKNALALGEIEVTSAVATLQQWGRNRLGVKAVDREWRALRKRKLAAKADRAATVIQNMIRTFLGRIHIMKMAQAIYTKYVDVDTGGVYWYNPRTKAAFWSKPGLLGTRDCGNPIQLPSPDEQHVVLCNTCDPAQEGGCSGAQLFCDDCEDIFCMDCFEVSHRSANKRDHLRIQLTLCVQCDFQAGSRYCLQCKDTFCDACYKSIHRKGRLSLHVYDHYTEQCGVCGERSAQWSRNDNDGTGITTHYCIVCYKQSFGLRPNVGDHDEGDEITPYNTDNADDTQPCVCRFEFKGKSVTDFRGARDREAKEKAIADAFAQRRAELQELKRHRSATNIQKRYRGRYTRRRIVPYVEKRREFFAVRENQTFLRENPIYRFMAYWGVAPFLASSTVIEKVLLSYPVHMHDILRDCINEDWKTACRLQREQDDHLEEAGNPSQIELLKARIGAANAEARYRAAEVKLARKMAELEVKKIKYREEKNRGDAKKSVVQELQEAAVQAGQDAQTLSHAKHVSEQERNDAMKKVVSFVGPKGLQHLVADKRKNGLLLPFTVHLHKGSRVAEVRYDDPPPPPTEEELKEKARQESEAAAAFALAAEERKKTAAKAAKKDGGGGGAGPPPGEEVEEEVYQPEAVKSSQALLLERLKEREAQQAVLDRLRQPLKDQDGYLVIDEDGMAVDSLGNRLEVDKQGRPTLHEDDSQFKVPEEDDPKLTNPLFGSWVKHVREGDVLLIDGVTFKVLARDEFVFDMRDETQDEKDEKGEDNEDDDEEEESDDEENAIDGDDLDYRDKKHKIQDLMIMDRKYSHDFICLDRPWMLDDTEYKSVYKMVPHKFYAKPVVAAAKAVLTSWAPQKAIQIHAINTHNSARLSAYLSTLFDAESDTGMRLKERSAELQAKRDNILRLSRQVVDMNYDFTMRRKFWKLCKSRAEAFVRFLRMMKSRADAASGDEAAALNFEVWDASENKVPIAIWLESPTAVDEKLGEVIMDLGAPIYVLRLYMYRDDAIRARLNELQGVNFQFFVVKENEDYDDENPSANAPGVESSVDWLLEPGQVEKMTYTSDFAPFKMDNKTMEGGNRCSIVLNNEITELEYCPLLDKRGNIIENEIASGSGQVAPG
jgi:hypothetical protein